MHEDHACMLYLNPFVSATNDHQLGEMVTIIGSSEAIALEQVEGYKRILYIADQSLSLIGSNWINRIFASLIHSSPADPKGRVASCWLDDGLPMPVGPSPFLAQNLKSRNLKLLCLYSAADVSQ